MSVESSDSKNPALNLSMNVDAGQVEQKLRDFVRGTVEETLNAMLDAEADTLCGAKRYERSEDRVDTRAGHYERELQTQAGSVTLKVPKLRKLNFETAIIERYKRRETSVEEALVEMYLAGVSVRRVEDITEALWGTRVSASTVSNLNKKVYGRIDEWRNAPITKRFPYVFADGIWLKRSWGGAVENVAVLVFIGVHEEGHREILGVYEGGKEDHTSWLESVRALKQRGLEAPYLCTTDKCLGLVQALAEVFPETLWQRCTVHFNRNVLGQVTDRHKDSVARKLKAIFAQESRPAAEAKAQTVIAELRSLKLNKAADCLENGLDDVLTYFACPASHWIRIRSNNTLERVNREIRRRTRVVGSFPDGNSALMLVAARLRHIAGTTWGKRCYLNMGALNDLLLEREAA